MRGWGGPLGVALVTALCAAALLWQGGRGPGGGVTARGAVGFGKVSLSTCSDWRDAGLADRQRLIADLGDHFGHRSHVWGGATLDGAQARGLLEGTCARAYARNIKLYKIYARGLTFSRLSASRARGAS